MLEKLLNLIDQFSKVEDNYDGEGATAPSLQVIIRTKEFLKNVPSEYLKCINIDDISLYSHGTIEIQFKCGANLVSVEVGHTTCNYYSYINQYDSEEYLDVNCLSDKFLMKLYDL